MTVMCCQFQQCLMLKVPMITELLVCKALCKLIILNLQQ